jgi:hypothetical protein
VPRRRLGRTGTMVLPIDPEGDERRTERLAAYLRNGIRPELDEAVLAALNLISGPKPDVLTGTAQAREYLFTLVGDFPDDVRQVVERADELLDRPLARGMS